MIIFQFFPRFVCLWIWAADFLSVNRWGQQHFAFSQTARQQQTDQPSSTDSHPTKPNPKLTQSNATTTNGTIQRERERQIHRGKERGHRANELNCYYANKLHSRENSVLCSAGIVNVFADIWMCNVFVAICTVHSVHSAHWLVIIIWQFWLVELRGWWHFPPLCLFVYGSSN